LINQNYSNVEIVCVDDGSTDKTLQKLWEIAKIDSRVKVFSKENEGVTKAREFGFRQSQGEYIGFVDADDYVEPEMFTLLYNNLKKYDTDISHCGYVIDGINGEKDYLYNTKRLAFQKRAEALKDLISGVFEPGLWNKLYKRNLLKSIFDSGVMDYSIKMNEDVLMNYYLFKEAKSSVLEDVCLYHYVKREGSATMSGFKKSNITDRLKVKQIIYEDSIGSEYEETATKAYLEKMIHSYNAFLKQNSVEYISEMNQIRELLVLHKKDAKVLDKKYKFLAKTLILSPKAYSKLYAKFS
jgi:glycosyltransferase involved in cell wall biosynthesis